MNDFSKCSPAQIVEAMADAMCQQMNDCTEHSLEMAGFTPDMQKTYGAKARARANEMATVRTVARIPARRAA
jgi:hypothetical protein